MLLVSDTLNGESVHCQLIIVFEPSALAKEDRLLSKLRHRACSSQLSASVSHIEAPRSRLGLSYIALHIEVPFL